MEVFSMQGMVSMCSVCVCVCMHACRPHLLNKEPRMMHTHRVTFTCVEDEWHICSLSP